MPKVANFTDDDHSDNDGKFGKLRSGCVVDAGRIDPVELIACPFAESRTQTLSYRQDFAYFAFGYRTGNSIDLQAVFALKCHYCLPGFFSCNTVDT